MPKWPSQSGKKHAAHFGKRARAQSLPILLIVGTIPHVMKSDIHPVYYKNATVTCACGNVLKTGGTKEKMEIEICSSCHPFFTGQEGKMIDTAGRVEKFKTRQTKAIESKGVKKARVAKNKKTA